MPRGQSVSEGMWPVVVLLFVMVLTTMRSVHLNHQHWGPLCLVLSRTSPPSWQASLCTSRKARTVASRGDSATPRAGQARSHEKGMSPLIRSSRGEISWVANDSVTHTSSLYSSNPSSWEGRCGKGDKQMCTAIIAWRLVPCRPENPNRLDELVSTEASARSGVRRGSRRGTGSHVFEAGVITIL